MLGVRMAQSRSPDGRVALNLLRRGWDGRQASGTTGFRATHWVLRKVRDDGDIKRTSERNPTLVHWLNQFTDLS